MATIEKFEDLIAWQKARQFAHEVYELTCLDKFSRDFSLVDQIRRSSGSVIDNIAEELSKVIGGFINYLLKSNITGRKFNAKTQNS